MLRVCHSLNPANEGALWSTTGAAIRSFEADTNVGADNGAECAKWVEAYGWAGWGADLSSSDTPGEEDGGRSTGRAWQLVESGGQCKCPPFAI